MEEWKEYKLGDVLTIKYGKDHKLLADGDIPIYGSGGIMRYGERSLYDGPSILIPRKGSLNNIMYSDKPFWTVDTMFWTIINNAIANPLFVYYAICKKDFASLNVGSAVPSLTVPVIEDIDILLPSLAEQDKIVSILKSLDDKIENNRRINENLEQQAQALFKSWFVDFEPFKDGEFVDSELGIIPKNWRVGAFGEIMTIASGKRPPKKESSFSHECNIPLVGASDIMGYTNSVLFNEDILVTGRVGTHGIVQRFNYPCWPSDNTLVLKSDYYEYCYQILCTIDYASLNRGSTQPLITQTDIKNQIILIPPYSVLSDFEKYASTLMKAKENNQRSSRRLAELRDALLPKLMSGEINVDDVTI